MHASQPLVRRAFALGAVGFVLLGAAWWLIAPQEPLSGLVFAGVGLVCAATAYLFTPSGGAISVASVDVGGNRRVAFVVPIMRSKLLLTGLLMLAFGIGLIVLGAVVVVAELLEGALLLLTLAFALALGAFAFGIGLNAFVGGLREANLVLLHDALVARMGIGQSIIPWTAVSGVRLDTVTGRGLTQTFLAVAYDRSHVGVRDAPFERWQRLVDRGSPSELRVAEALLSIQADEAALAIARLHAIPELRRHVGTPAGLELLRG